MKVEIVYPKRAFDEQFDKAHATPSELVRVSVVEAELIERRKQDARPVVLLLGTQTSDDFERMCGLMRKLQCVENAVCEFSNHFYVIINGLTSGERLTKSADEDQWHRQAELLYELGADEVHGLAMDELLMAARLHSLGGRMLERVRQQQAAVRYEEAQELGSIGSWHHDFVTNQSWWSNQVYKIFGRDPRRGTPDCNEFRSMLHPEDQLIYYTAVQDCIQNGLPFQLEHRLVHSDESTRIVYCWGTPVINDFGEVAEMSGVLQDITERRQAENDLRHHEAALSFIGEGAPAMMYSLRMDIENALWVDYYSVGSVENFGKTMPIKGERLEPFLRLHHSQELYDEIQRQCIESARELTPWAREFRIEDDFGDSRWISGRSMPARLDDGTVIWRGVLDDVTEQKHLEEQLQMSDRLSSIGTLAAGIAHEINNPLSFVMSNLEYTLEEIQRYTDCQPDNELELALLSGLDGARRISVIVKGLMTYARHSDELDDVVDLDEVIQTAIRMTHSQFRYNTELRLELGFKPMVIGNEGQLCQVFVNLILNALHAMPPDRPRGNLIIVRFLELDSDSIICVEIEDNGEGIPEKMHKRLFDPFYSTKAVGQGTGLGLYVCRNMVTAMGGRLELESTSGAGSVFRVFLNRVSAS